MNEVIVEKMTYPWHPMRQDVWIVLKEKNKDRRLYINIGRREAVAMILALEEEKLPRPLEHDLITTLFEKLDGKIKEVAITRIEDRTFFATISVESEGAVHAIDARPSDALALATREKVPIFVHKKILEWASKTDYVTKQGRQVIFWPE
ncbi:MAG: bifunctional nuclease family protein [Anaerolineaceae bacterium]|nr:bifunctional nuclease family protein [Anaerolineaceae bacterium]